MKYIRRVLLLMLVLMLLATSGCGSQKTTSNNEVLNLKLGHISVEDYTYHYYALKFKELVEEKTNGKVNITIYPNAQLGQNRELVESLQSGNIDLGVLATAPMTNFISELGILDIPFLFDDWAHVEKFCFSDVAKDLISKSEKANIKSFSIGPLGFRDLTNSVRPVYTPDDLKGLKIRVLESDIYLDAFTELGATASAMAWADAFTAMQQGAIDGQENDPSVIYGQGVYDVQKYVSLTDHIFAFFTLNASKKRFETWPEDVQIAIAEAANEANHYIFTKTKEEMADYVEKLKEKGMEINEVDKEAFKKSAVNTQNKYKQIYGEELFNSIKNIQ